MFLSNYERDLLSLTVSMEMDTIESILTKNEMANELPEESITRFENGLLVLSITLRKINTYHIVEFDEEQSYHIRHAIALHLRALMEALLSDEPMTDEDCNALSDAVNTLLFLHKRLQ